MSTKNTSNETESQPSLLGDVMHRLYQEISKEHRVPVDRILLAITDNAMYFQAYSTNEVETELFYLCDVPIPNGA